MHARAHASAPGAATPDPSTAVEGGALGLVTKDQLVFRTYTTLSRGLAALPEPAALVVANAVGDVLFRVRHEHRRMVTNNLRRILGGVADDADGGDEPDDADDANDAAILDRWARRSFRAYARYWVEGARLGSTAPAEVEQRTFVQGLQYLVEGIAAGKGVIMALPHVGSWEYGGAFLATQDLPMTSVAERIEPPELFEFFVEQRADMGLTIVPLDGSSGGAIVSTLRRGGLVGLLCDRDLNGTGVEVQFFGERTTMPAGPATLALRTGATLVTGAVYSGPGNDHRGIVDPPIDTTRQGSLRSDVARHHPGDRPSLRTGDPPGPRPVARLPAVLVGGPPRGPGMTKFESRSLPLFELFGPEAPTGEQEPDLHHAGSAPAVEPGPATLGGEPRFHSVGEQESDGGGRARRTWAVRLRQPCGRAVVRLRHAATWWGWTPSPSSIPPASITCAPSSTTWWRAAGSRSRSRCRRCGPTAGRSTST